MEAIFTDKLFLVMSRLAPVFISSLGPFRYMPSFVRVVILIVFAMVLTVSGNIQINATIPFYQQIFSELTFGFGTLFVFVMSFGAILFFGRLVDLQIGFGAAGVVDPGNKSQEPLLGMAYLTLITLMFFLMNLHTDLFVFWHYSLSVMPLGSPLGYQWLSQALPFLTSIFFIAMVIFAPVILVLWCVDVTIGVLSKSMPQMNIYFVALPFKILLGIATLMLVVVPAKAPIERLFTIMMSHISGGLL
ncbi:flagellar biosynthetic protein FliR [Catenovulum sp. SM1970]|uniref:flagellar biosynthetic protein FliR n=1 Tax=Marinifaba aquimaris TaxID=2741323 RepID=UPI0015747CF4|nr:flagellar biosynthetic protein FliR [Marinifaba aquimaris]NTS77397.1 flagellar biosynthetic protein FliR [Marinifaba aquimaris]